MDITTLTALAAQIKNETVEEANTALRVGTMFEAFIDYIKNMTGWAFYADNQYTEANPYRLTVASGWTTILNNGAVFNTSQMPDEIAAMLTGGLITGRNGDGLNVLLQFKVKPVSNNPSITVDTALNIGGSLNRIFPRSTRVNRGAGEVYNYLSSIAGFQGETFAANGALTQYRVEEADVDLFDFQVVLTRTHKAIV